MKAISITPIWDRVIFKKDLAYSAYLVGCPRVILIKCKGPMAKRKREFITAIRSLGQSLRSRLGRARAKTSVGLIRFVDQADCRRQPFDGNGEASRELPTVFFWGMKGKEFLEAKNDFSRLSIQKRQT